MSLSSPKGGGIIKGTTFVPLRMEVLEGGPSSPGGPIRLEWERSNKWQSWNEARSLLPFTPPNKIQDAKCITNYISNHGHSL